MKISPTNFAKSGNCPKKLSSYFKRLDCNIKKNTSLASRDDVASRIGKIVHDLVQEVICSGGKKERDKKKDEIMLVLENMKNDMNLDNNSLSEIIGHNPFENLLHDQGIVRLYEECGPLMEATMKLLSNLEDKFGDMTAIKEFEIKPKGTSRINIAGKEVFLGGFVDLVLLFKKEKKRYAILLELKTGDYSIKKDLEWERQICIYQYAWKKIYPNHKILSFVVNSTISNGYKKYDYNNFYSGLEKLMKAKINDVLPGENCSYCNFKNSCNKSKY